jgi:hypothetical protein
MQASDPLFDAINVTVADAIFRAIQKGADPLVAISAADFGRGASCLFAKEFRRGGEL